MRGKNRRHTRSSRENPSSVHAQSASCPLFLLLLSPLHQISPAVRLPSLAISYSEAAGHAGPDVCCLAPRALLSGCAGEMFRTEESGCKRLCVWRRMLHSALRVPALASPDPLSLLQLECDSAGFLLHDSGIRLPPDSLCFLLFVSRSPTHSSSSSDSYSVTRVFLRFRSLSVCLSPRVA